MKIRILVFGMVHLLMCTAFASDGQWNGFNDDCSIDGPADWYNDNIPDKPILWQENWHHPNSTYLDYPAGHDSGEIIQPSKIEIPDYGPSTIVLDYFGASSGVKYDLGINPATTMGNYGLDSRAQDPGVWDSFYDNYAVNLCFRVAGFINDPGFPPGSDQMQHYTDVGALDPDGLVTIRMAAGVTNIYSDVEIENAYFRIWFWDGSYRDYPIDYSKLKPHPGSNRNDWYLECHLLEFDIPYSFFECYNGPTRGGFCVDFRYDAYCAGEDTWFLGGFHLFPTLVMDWVAVEWKEVAPVVLVHGNGLDGDWWGPEQTGFMYGREIDGSDQINYKGLNHWIPEGLIDNSISLSEPENGRNQKEINAAQIKDKLEDITKRLGVDRVHVITHSKGGLDTRQYLGDINLYEPEESVRIISLQTLGTPHDGSILANLRDETVRSIAAGALGAGSAKQEFAALYTTLTQPDAGNWDLVPANAKKFNKLNIPNLPLKDDLLYRTYWGRADVDNTDKIETSGAPGWRLYPDGSRLQDKSGELGIMQEIIQHTQGGFASYKLGKAANVMYQMLAHKSSYRQAVINKRIYAGPFYGTITIKVATPVTTGTAMTIQNDMLVTKHSAGGYGASRRQGRGFSVLSGRSISVYATAGANLDLANHSEICHYQHARNGLLGTTIYKADRLHGYLQDEEE